jgi:hypothetical protein
MLTTILPLLKGPRCDCGAARRSQQPTCRKCCARDRWHRRTQLHRGAHREADQHRAAPLLRVRPLGSEPAQPRGSCRDAALRSGRARVATTAR